MKKFTKSQFVISIAASLTLLVGIGVGYWAGSESTDESTDTAGLDNPCSDLLTSSDARSAMNGVLRAVDSPSYRFIEKGTSGDFSSECTVVSGEKDALSITAHLAMSGDVVQWTKTLSDNKDIGHSSSRKTFSVGEAGISSPAAAAIYLSCEPYQSPIKKKQNLSILVSSLNGSSHHSELRTELADLAVSMAKHAQIAAKCKDPAQIPEKAPELS
ncbi:hypothetical protein [Streptomyces sp. PSAA01]|uniref:hypothetical protein n=1 Tax=Streptomyces sp. PSAA01 TaxID=2912762 RepID=UPI001F2F8EA2|nr:hypothetical protein [Streptomyces sp. PSAA01]MCG0288511.1 hypothetical protein [Streptomyces sp. PSAA01]